MNESRHGTGEAEKCISALLSPFSSLLLYSPKANRGERIRTSDFQLPKLAL